MELARFGWMISDVMEGRPDSLTVLLDLLEPTIVHTVKMLESDVLHVSSSGFYITLLGRDYTSLSCAVCNQGDIRLQGGANNMTGRVEICNLHQWGTVCDDIWGVQDAQVACRQLGFASTGT